MTTEALGNGFHFEGWALVKSAKNELVFAKQVIEPNYPTIFCASLYPCMIKKTLRLVYFVFLLFFGRGTSALSRFNREARTKKSPPVRLDFWIFRVNVARTKH